MHVATYSIVVFDYIFVHRIPCRIGIYGGLKIKMGHGHEHMDTSICMDMTMGCMHVPWT